MLIVQKFGGTSVGTVERIQAVARRVLATQKKGHKVAVVVSAMSGQTNKLLELAHQVHPEPSEETRDASTLYLTFAAPEADTFVVEYDAYIQPSSQRGAIATVGVVEDDVTVASVEISTHLLP